MGYLNLPNGVPDFSKAVISLWFRVAQDALDAGVADYDAHVNDDVVPVAVGLIPFVTFGATAPWTPEGGGTPQTAGPSYIGIQAQRNSDNSTSCNLGARFQFQTMDGWYGPSPGPPTITSGGFVYVGSDNATLIARPGGGSPLWITPAPSQWHHLLMSADFTGGVTANPGSIGAVATGWRCWLAYDDANYNGDYLWPCGVYALRGFGGLPASGDLNAVMSGFAIASLANGVNGQPYSYTPGPLPAHGHSIGLPSDQTRIIQHIEMAEFQFFTGVTLDTSVTANRRAFIDANGKPVPPSKVASSGDATVGSIALLGKPPDVALIGSSNWIAGTNSGASGSSFTPTGVIKAYTPAAALGS